MNSLQQHGISVEHTKRIRRMTPIDRIITQVDHRIGIYLDLLKSAQFGIVLEKMSPREKQILITQINGVTDHLSAIADAVEIDLGHAKAKSAVPKNPLVMVRQPLKSLPSNGEQRRPPPVKLKRGEW